MTGVQTCALPISDSRAQLVEQDQEGRYASDNLRIALGPWKRLDNVPDLQQPFTPASALPFAFGIAVVASSTAEREGGGEVGEVSVEEGRGFGREREGGEGWSGGAASAGGAGE